MLLRLHVIKVPFSHMIPFIKELVRDKVFKWYTLYIQTNSCRSRSATAPLSRVCPVFQPGSSSLRKHAYSTILENLSSKIENFQIKNSDIFHISAQNIDCGYSLEPPQRGGSNEYPQSMFRAEITKIMYTPVNPSFTT